LPVVHVSVRIATQMDYMYLILKLVP